MNQNIINYLQENKEKYPKEALIEQLMKTGYVEQDIQEATSYVYGAVVPEPAQQDFWDFKSSKIYLKSSEKWKDFLFGFFAPFIVGFVGSIVPLVGPLIIMAFYIFALIYLFSRRRFIFYGMLAEFIAIPGLVLFAYFLFFGANMHSFF